MPALSPTMEEGTLAKWLVKEGDVVKSGQIMAEIETDKATMEFEAVDEGIVGTILVAEGTAGVKVNTPIAVLVEAGESVDATPAPMVAAAPVAAAAPVTAPAAKAPVEIKSAASPDWPAGTAMKTMTVREALREAMAEEMRANPNVFLMGEEVGEYQGAYKISQGLLDEFGPKRVVDTPITEHGFAGIAVGAIGNHIGATIMMRAFDYLDAPVINCTGKDVPMPYAANLEKHALLTTAEVIEAVKSVCYR